MFNLNLKNGTIQVPKSFGGYVISTGCGSGKTTAIREELISKYYNDGILYCVDTKDECTKMYDWIKYNLVNDTDLTINDVMCIHWDQVEEMYKYISDPEQVMYKKILIITHVRFWTDLINFFVICNPQSPVETFDGDFSRLMQRDDLRKLIIFDETPQFFKPFEKISSCVVTNLKTYYSNNGEINTYNLNEVRGWFDDNFSMCPDPINPFKTNTKLGRMKKDTTLSYISRNLKVLKRDIDIAKKKESDKGRKVGISRIHFYPTHLLQNNMKSMVLVFEGAGDLLFNYQTQTENYKLFDVIDNPNKYNCTINFVPFSFDQKRRRDVLPENELKNTQSFREHINILADVIMNRHNKTLLAVWKDKGDMNNPIIPDYVKVVREALDNLGVDQNRYAITYYGAADNKSTNQYRDFDAIMLVGNRDIPEDEVLSISKAYSLGLSRDLHKLWFYIQLITRIGIRNYDGGTYTVYYSNDFEKKLIDNIKKHLGNCNIQQLAYEIPDLEEELDKVIKAKVSGYHQENLQKLINVFPELNNIILNDVKGYIINITLKDLNNVLGLNKKKSRDYDRLIKELADKLFITLNIC